MGGIGKWGSLRVKSPGFLPGYTALAIKTVYFKGEVSPYGWAEVPAYPLCGGGFFRLHAPATPPNFCQSISRGVLPGDIFMPKRVYRSKYFI
jgi:hypothetical protein